MYTNDSQFLKAYSDLVSAFFNFMNVVNPQDRQQPDISYIASQLNQLLNYLSAVSQTTAKPTIQQSQIPTIAEPPAQNPPATESIPYVQDYTSQEDQPQTTFNLTNAKLKFCAYPELVNGRYKFKSSMISEAVGEDSVYKLTIDENAQTGFVEIRDLTGDILKTVANNPSLYTPLDICPEASSITTEKKSVTSRSKLHLIKAVRGWEIADGEKFILTIS